MYIIIILSPAVIGSFVICIVGTGISSLNWNFAEV